MNNIQNNLQQFFTSGITKSLEFRLEQLNKLHSAVSEYESKIYAALEKDLGKHPLETYLSEISFVQHEILFVIKNLKSWMKPVKVHTPLLLFPARSVIYPDPLGTVLIIAPWNYPFQLAISPLIAAIAAGCCAVVKPSEFSPNTSQIIEEMVSSIFPREYVTVATGGVDVSELLLKQKFDHIFFTGSTSVGKIVMTNAAQNLTSVTLELGGKSPCIVDDTADLKSAAKKIMWGKCLNSGQTCIAPDYVFASDNIRYELMSEMSTAVELFYGKDPISNPEYPHIITKRHFDRLVSLIPSDKIYSGGRTDAEKLKIEPTIIDDPAIDSPLMKDEIFGPLMPVLPMKNLQEVVIFINSRPKPLSLYMFTKSNNARKEVINNISFGSGAFNDVLIQLVNPHLPFGGVGASGMGRYHGKAGFDTFTHYKSVLERKYLLDFGIQYPPYNNRLGLVKKLFKFL